LRLSGPLADPPREIVTGAVRQAINFAKGFNPAFSALDEIALLAVPAILRNRVIVIDDIERMHAALNIEEVMGFIDEFTQVYGVRILLISNSDQLDDKSVWDTLREKVIDHEIALETTPEEAFDIAIQNVHSRSAGRIREATITCKLTNIRIIQKIIRAVDRLLSTRSDLTDEVLQRVVPSTVLLSAIHYKGLYDGPDFKYVLTFNSMACAVAKIRKRKSVDDETEQGRLEAKWAQLMDALNISSSDEYEELVAAFRGLAVVPMHCDALFMQITRQQVRHWHYGSKCQIPAKYHGNPAGLFLDQPLGQRGIKVIGMSGKPSRQFCRKLSGGSPISAR
jgi:hypothetical protein